MPTSAVSSDCTRPTSPRSTAVARSLDISGMAKNKIEPGLFGVAIVARREHQRRADVRVDIVVRRSLEIKLCRQRGVRPRAQLDMIVRRANGLYRFVVIGYDCPQ